MHIQKQGDGDHLRMFLQLVCGLSQNGDTRPKVVSNRMVWTGENLSSLMVILLVSDPKTFLFALKCYNHYILIFLWNIHPKR